MMQALNPSSHKPHWGVVIFPGSNCDHDALVAASNACGGEVRAIWHREDGIGECDAIVLPGGFSYGDYLRSGAIARFAPAMTPVVAMAGQGTLVIGICNGFQILTEAGLLPGALMRNAGLRFICREVRIRVERTDTPFTHLYREGQILSVPIAHNEGSFYLPQEQLDELERNRQVVFRYCDSQGQITDSANPNGSLNNIAGIVNPEGNILGMMPHPERRTDRLLGAPDGKLLFKSMNRHLIRRFNETPNPLEQTESTAGQTTDNPGPA